MNPTIKKELKQKSKNELIALVANLVESLARAQVMLAEQQQKLQNRILPTPTKD